MALLVFVICATARNKEGKPPVDVAVCVADDGYVPNSDLRTARTTVSRIYAVIGVHIAWPAVRQCTARASDGPIAIFVRFDRRSGTWASHSQDALGWVSPFGENSKTITILYDRIQIIAGRVEWEQQILAHVLAHEIGHVLQGTDYHAPSGVMKAHWSTADLAAMQVRPLEFTSTDVSLIRHGLNLPEAPVGTNGGNHRQGRCSNLFPMTVESDLRTFPRWEDRRRSPCA